MVDGSDRISYGPYINNKICFWEASTEITAGLGGKLYVETLCFVSSKKSLCVV